MNVNISITLFVSDIFWFGSRAGIRITVIGPFRTNLYYGIEARRLFCGKIYGSNIFNLNPKVLFFFSFHDILKVGWTFVVI